MIDHRLCVVLPPPLIPFSLLDYSSNIVFPIAIPLSTSRQHRQSHCRSHSNQFRGFQNTGRGKQPDRHLRHSTLGRSCCIDTKDFFHDCFQGHGQVPFAMVFADLAALRDTASPIFIDRTRTVSVRVRVRRNPNDETTFRSSLFRGGTVGSSDDLSERGPDRGSKPRFRVKQVVSVSALDGSTPRNIVFW